MWKLTEPVIVQNKPESPKIMDCPIDTNTSLYPTKVSKQIPKQNNCPPLYFDFNFCFSNPRSSTSCFSPIGHPEQCRENNHQYINGYPAHGEEKEKEYLFFSILKSSLEKSGYSKINSTQDVCFPYININVGPTCEGHYNTPHGSFKNFGGNNFSNNAVNFNPTVFHRNSSGNITDCGSTFTNYNCNTYNNTYNNTNNHPNTPTNYTFTGIAFKSNYSYTTFNNNSGYNNNVHISTPVNSVRAPHNLNLNLKANLTHLNSHHHNHNTLYQNGNQFPPCAKITVIQNLSDSKTHGETDGDNEANEKSTEDKKILSSKSIIIGNTNIKRSHSNEGKNNKNICVSSNMGLGGNQNNNNSVGKDLKFNMNNELKKMENAINASLNGINSEKKKILFECSGSDAATASSCKSHLKKKRFRKNNDQLIHLSSFYSENKNKEWSKKQIKEISEKIGLGGDKIYKWLWDQKNKEFKANKFIVNKDKGKCK